VRATASALASTTSTTSTLTPLTLVNSTDLVNYVSLLFCCYFFQRR
jgi:hypothetical protein